MNADALDLLGEDRGRKHLCRGSKDGVQETPTLLVSTAATTRGLDLPELSHIFIVGVPEGLSFSGQTIDTYLHLAGRVGRFGRGGKVVTVVERAEAEENNEEGKAVRPVKDEPKVMARLLKELKIPVTRLEHFD